MKYHRTLNQKGRAVSLELEIGACAAGVGGICSECT